jgi:hypothetical protein
LEQNIALNNAEYAAARRIVAKVQHVYDRWAGFVGENALDPDVFFPGNQWRDLAPVSGLRFRDDYNNLNWHRLLAPHAGYYLLLLDRMDGARRFANPWPENQLARMLVGWDLPDDLPELMGRYLDPDERLADVPQQQAQLVHGLPPELAVGAPPRFGEIGLLIDGLLVNPDTIRVQGRINAMHAAGVLRHLAHRIERHGRARVVEIGAGYGAVAHALMHIFKGALDYFVIDQPTVLYSSAIYLGGLWGYDKAALPVDTDNVRLDQRLVFVVNYLLPRFASTIGPVDLAINTMSMNEMSEPQVRYYAAFIRDALGEDGLFYEENAVGHPDHTDCRTIFRAYFRYQKRIESSSIQIGPGEPFIWHGAISR